jgi:hypothetical protein
MDRKSQHRLGIAIPMMATIDSIVQTFICRDEIMTSFQPNN